MDIQEKEMINRAGSVGLKYKIINWLIDQDQLDGNTTEVID